MADVGLNAFAIDTEPSALDSLEVATRYKLIWTVSIMCRWTSNIDEEFAPITPGLTKSIEGTKVKNLRIILVVDLRSGAVDLSWFVLSSFHAFCVMA